MPTFGRVAPSIPVSDIGRALGFYRDVLGFMVTFTNGMPVTFAVIQQGEAEVHLVTQPDRAGSAHAHLMVDDLDGVYAALKKASIPLRQPPKIQAWGLRDLVVADLDGNTFEIAHAAENPSSGQPFTLHPSDLSEVEK